MPATVRIWPNRWGPKAIGHPGHASLEITHHAESAYISWWPEGLKKIKKFSDGAGQPNNYHEDLYYEMSTTTRQLLRATPAADRVLRPGQEQQTLHNIVRENSLGNIVRETTMPDTWVQAPLHTIHVAGKDDPGSDGIGLNLERIIDWWEIFQRAPNASYRFVSRTINCASVVGAALQAGGASLFTGKDLGGYSSTWHTPNDVVVFANDINRRILNLRLFVQAVQTPVGQLPLMARRQMTPFDWQTSMTPNAHIGGDLMTFAAWKTLSDRNIKYAFFARRKEQVAKIDELLEEYHQLPWPPDNVGVHGEQRERKRQLLNGMLEQVYSHMREKPNSDRAEAVFILGRQIVSVLTRPDAP